ncbi:helix-turn-helix domain-containing protein [Crassaminicella indica]|uniref:Helix-turn-helix domain-containing protein n=1 Tax=Crassaminicella indica TaxID=2855394 RepID=A0ABX8RAV7_9CLOT|nr:helix-turn-helix domain-containing protein [Crassaminicella indica]QXM05941.1 helix-turn-helix domain-containing protein [Crassaminicella indica]
MKKKLGNYIMEKNKDKFSEIDFHDFIDMVQSGLSTQEIAKELGVSRSYIERLKNEMKKDF